MTPPACAGSRNSARRRPRARKPRRRATGARDGDAVADDAAIVFTPSGLRGRFPLGTPVLQAARALGVDVDSVCGGRGICGRCQVTQVEQAYGARKPMEAGRRLSCTAKILGDVVIDVPAESQAHRQIVRKAAEAVAIELDPAIRL